MKRYDAILGAITSGIWAILPEKMDALLGLLEMRMAGLATDAQTLEKLAVDNLTRSAPRMARSVAVLPIVGTIVQRGDLLTESSGAISTERLGKDIEGLVNDPDVGAVVLDIDSPGGNYYGTGELADKIMALRGSKPIVAVANSLAASAAYWIASAADEIVATPGGDVGSVGVLAIHTDLSAANEQEGIRRTYVIYGRYKAEYNEDSPLSAESVAELQRRVNEAGESFVASLAHNRGVKVAEVRDRYGQGRVFGAREALDRGMVDRVATLEETIARLAGSGRGSGRSGRRTAIQRQRLALDRFGARR